MRLRTLDRRFRDSENRNEMHSMRGWLQGLGGSVMVTGGVVAAALAALAFVAFHAGGTSRTVTGKVGKVSVRTLQGRHGTADAAASSSAPGGTSVSGVDPPARIEVVLVAAAMSPPTASAGAAAAPLPAGPRPRGPLGPGVPAGRGA